MFMLGFDFFKEKKNTFNDYYGEKSSKTAK